MEHIRTESEYNAVVSDLADSAIELAEELATSGDYDNAKDALYDAIHETVDSSYYMTYTRFHLPIIQFSTNPDAWEEMFRCSDLAEFLKEEGLRRLHCIIAFNALRADVDEIAYERINETT